MSQKNGVLALGKFTTLPAKRVESRYLFLLSSVGEIGREEPHSSGISKECEMISLWSGRDFSASEIREEGRYKSSICLDSK